MNPDESSEYLFDGSAEYTVVDPDTGGSCKEFSALQPGRYTAKFCHMTTVEAEPTCAETTFDYPVSGPVTMVVR